MVKSCALWYYAVTDFIFPTLSHLFMPSSFWRSLIRVLVFSPRADLDLILFLFLLGIGDAVGDRVLPSSASRNLVTAMIGNGLLVTCKCCFMQCIDQSIKLMDGLIDWLTDLPIDKLISQHNCPISRTQISLFFHQWEYRPTACASTATLTMQFFTNKKTDRCRIVTLINWLVEWLKSSMLDKF